MMLYHYDNPDSNYPLKPKNTCSTLMKPVTGLTRNCILKEAQDQNSSIQSEQLCSRIIRKHKLVQENISDYKSKIGNLAVLVREISAKDNPDKEKCLDQQKLLEDQLKNLEALSDLRAQQLNELNKSLKFKQQLEEFNNWISDRYRIAGNTDLGKDTHHCQRLLDRFETWSRETASVSNDKLEI